jgi:hypothetical protein
VQNSNSYWVKLNQIDMTEFCRHLKNGLVYNNDTTSFTVSPCCFFRGDRHKINPNQDLSSQLAGHRNYWMTADVRSDCKICIDAEEQNTPSYRQASFDFIQGTDNRLEFLTVAVNKKCNLACASCSAASSSFWYQENSRHQMVQGSSIHQMHQEDRQGIIADKFVQLLAEQDLSGLRYIKFGGGEPLMSDTHEQIMALIPDPSKVTVQYTSNFSIMPSKTVLRTWEKFKLVKWIASLDGVGEQFSLLRWPYRWEKLEAFATDAISTVPGNVMFGVEHTVNPLNAFYIDHFQTWFDQHIGSNRYGDSSDFNIHLCTGVLGIEHTPPALRNKIKIKYGAKHAISVALDQKPYSGSVTALVQYLDQLDQWRSTNWRSVFSEVQEFFNA